MSLKKKNKSTSTSSTSTSTATSTSTDVETKMINEPKASLVLFYQYVNPLWTPSKVSAFSQYITNIMKSHRTNLGGRMRISTEGVNCTVSSASTNNDNNSSNDDPAFEAAQTLRHFIQDIKNFDPNSFEDTDFKYIDNLSADRHFKEMKLLPVKELVYYGIRSNGDDTITAAANNTSTQHQQHQVVIPKNVNGGIHLNPKEYHEMLKKDDAVVIDVRNHYEAAIGRFDGQMMSQTKDGSNGNDEEEGVKSSSGATYIDPKMRKSTDFTSWLEDSKTKQKLEGKTVMMFCTGGIRCERASAYLNSKMGSQVKGVYQLQGGIERYLQAFPDGGFWRGKNFVFDKREAVAPGNMNGDGGVLKKESGKTKSKLKDGDKLLSWGTECAKCFRPWDRYVGKRKCFTCGVPILLCDECLSQSTMHKKNKKRKNNDNLDSDTQSPAVANTTVGDETTQESCIDIDQVRCPLCVEEGVTVPANQVEYTDNGVRGRTRTDSFSEGCEGFTSSSTETHQAKKAAKSVLKWGGGHASKKKEKRKYSRKLCQFGSDCVRKDCFFYHPEKGGGPKK